MPKQLLIETTPVEFTILEEASPKNGGRMRVKGIFTVADEINGNGRVYREHILDREIEKLKELMAENRVFAEADHPEDGKSRISNTAAMLTGIEKQVIDGRKVYVGEAVVLNTSKGRDLQEIIRAGGRPGVSSRGWGSLIKGNWQGKVADIVQEDYTLKTFDFVIGQSTKDAEITQFFEQMDVINVLNVDEIPQETSKKGGKSVMEIKTIDDLKKAYPELCEQLVKEAVSQKEKEIRESFEKDFDARVMKEVEAKREEIKNEVINEIKNSEEIQTAFATLVEIGKLVRPYIKDDEDIDEADKDEEIAKLKARIAELEAEIESLRRAKEEAEEKEKVSKKIQEVTAGKKFEKLLAERLSDCRSVEEVERRLAQEEAYIQKLLGEVSATDMPKGKGQVLDENKKDEELDQVKAYQRKLAGINEDVKRKTASA